jgi:hypothetical protein
LPLAKKAGGHRLGINGLAVDEDNSILCDVPQKHGYPPTDNAKGTLVAGMAQFVLGISI